MIPAIILILAAVALFLIFHDDHDDSYTRSDKKPGRNAGPKSEYQKSVESRRTSATPRQAPVMDPRTIVPKEYPPRKLDERFKPTQAEPKYASAPNTAPRRETRASGFAYEEKVLDYHFLDRIDYDPSLPERTMSSFIAGLQGHCTTRDLGGLVGYVSVDRATGAMEVHDGPDDRLLGYLPMKDRAAFHTFNPGLVICPFAGHVAISVTGALYADIRIVLPSTRDFVEESLVGFLG